MIIWTSDHPRRLPERISKCGFLAKTVKPLDISFMAKPCQLAFSVVAHVQFGLFDSAVESRRPCKYSTTRR